jgi:hypothetical protein
VSYITNLVRPPLRGPAESGSGHCAGIISARLQMNRVYPSNQASIRSPSVPQQVSEGESSTPGAAPVPQVAMVIQSSEQFSVHLLPVIVNGDERRCRPRGALAIGVPYAKACPLLDTIAPNSALPSRCISGEVAASYDAECM